MSMYSGSRGRPAPPTPQPTLQQPHMVPNNTNMMQSPHIPTGHNYMQAAPHQGHPGVPNAPSQRRHPGSDSAIDRMSSMLLALDTDTNYRNQA